MSDQTVDTVAVPVDGVELEGELTLPAGAIGLVVFAHGSGSSRHSPRNNFVAQVLRSHGLGTFLFDLLTETEDREYETRFDIDLLTERLLAVTEWLRGREETRDLHIGYFGSSTGAAAALRAAATRGDDVDAVVSRGGRVDLATERLPEVTAATLLVVGGADTAVLELNRAAQGALTCPNALEVVDDAGHLFEGTGELEVVAELAADWFEQELS
ncbi:dienelactone hydrolase family protein [Halobaculum limi]|uniref:dienelactone hydrolase family protein n=1 Tax=Halobaculum limi TaxID=3031916 RepID=UPI00240712C8|nr:alpha/beta hydrolase [Halobaculum sp. YSMS11]